MKITVHNRFTRASAQDERRRVAHDAFLHRGDRVYDVADPRHLGIIEMILYTSSGAKAKIRWEETGWVSMDIPLSDLRKAPDENRGHGPQSELQTRLRR